MSHSNSVVDFSSIHKERGGGEGVRGPERGGGRGRERERVSEDEREKAYVSVVEIFYLTKNGGGSRVEGYTYYFYVWTAAGQATGNCLILQINLEP